MLKQFLDVQLQYYISNVSFTESKKLQKFKLGGCAYQLHIII